MTEEWETWSELDNRRQTEKQKSSGLVVVAKKYASIQNIFIDVDVAILDHGVLLHKPKRCMLLTSTIDSGLFWYNGSRQYSVDTEVSTNVFFSQKS